MKVCGIIGWKNSGKTNLIERLIAELTTRGFAVSTIKHAHHSCDVDHEGKDTYRHRQAGANEVILASRARFALMHEIRDEQEVTLETLLSKLSPVDLVLVEGFKKGHHKKIEAHRKETGQPLLAQNDIHICAVASNTALTIDRPVFGLDDAVSISDFIIMEMGL